MDEGLLFVAGIVAALVTVIAAFMGWLERRNGPGRERIRRATGNALFGLQQFVEPSVEYIHQAHNVEQKDDDDEGLGIDATLLRSGLAEALGRSPVDEEEIRRHLAAAVRLGLDWKFLFEQAVEVELSERPFRAPSMPPARRVAPRE